MSPAWDLGFRRGRGARWSRPPLGRRRRSPRPSPPSPTSITATRQRYGEPRKARRSDLAPRRRRSRRAPARPRRQGGRPARPVSDRLTSAFMRSLILQVGTEFGPDPQPGSRSHDVSTRAVEPCRWYLSVNDGICPLRSPMSSVSVSCARAWVSRRAARLDGSSLTWPSSPRAPLRAEL